MRLEQDAALDVGRLGKVTVPEGWCFYAGSALGPGGLAARLGRHRRVDKRPHWHIDYLLCQATPVADWRIASPARLECAWADALLQLPTASTPVRRFGASDCRCRTHLVHVTRLPPVEQVCQVLAAASPPGSIVYHVPYGDATGR
ncbi:MAG: GIY-YIG nuclease family protein [Anaerolineae bacterium]|nr:GIY-YIG nuclease family protein [Anaerolineae bacterium]